MLNNQYMKVFTHTPDQEKLNKIGRVVCKEFGFKDLDTINAILDPHLRNQFTSDKEYFHYTNKKSVSGLECSGNEQTLKDCTSKEMNSTSVEMYELEIECLCMYFFL